MTKDELQQLGIRANRGKCVILREEDTTVQRHVGEQALIQLPPAFVQDYLMAMTTYAGIIIALGPPALTEGGTEIKSDFQEGDRVIFGRYAGQDVKLPKDFGEQEVFTLYTKDIHFGIPHRR